MARRATLISTERDDNPHVLVVDAGDTLNGDIPRGEDRELNQESQGALAVEAMNLLAYDGVALGERDLEWGVEILLQRIEQAQFPFLSANVYLAGTDELLAQPYVILDVGDYHVALVGLTGTPAGPLPDFEVRKPLAIAQKMVAELAPQADMLIFLSHLGWQQNLLLSAISPEIDLIISGGAEAAPQEAYLSPSTGTRLVQAETPTAGHAGRHVGRWEVTLDPGQEIQFGAWQIVSLGPDWSDDPAAVDLIRRYGGEE